MSSSIRDIPKIYLYMEDESLYKIGNRGSVTLPKDYLIVNLGSYPLHYCDDVPSISKYLNFDHREYIQEIKDNFHEIGNLGTLKCVTGDIVNYSSTSFPLYSSRMKRKLIAEFLQFTIEDLSSIIMEYLQETYYIIFLNNGSHILGVNLSKSSLDKLLLNDPVEGMFRNDHGYNASFEPLSDNTKDHLFYWVCSEYLL